MYDRFNRRINYLRISVTDRCNLRCFYCMPEEGIRLLNHDDILTYEEMAEVVEVAAGKGISKVRVTGGEPLVRKGIVHFIALLERIQGIEDLSMTTNGTLLEEFAQPLAEAGLHRVNISLDTLDPGLYRKVTRGGDVTAVINGIRAAKRTGLTPVKINCVVLEDEKKQDLERMKQFAAEEGVELRYIHQMNLGKGHFSVVEGGEGGKCELCNRLRLTANGKIKPCLFSDLEFDIRELGIAKAIRQAVQWKPEKGTVNSKDLFCSIGG